jgi:hypothetical protein
LCFQTICMAAARRRNIRFRSAGSYGASVRQTRAEPGRESARGYHDFASWAAPVSHRPPHHLPSLPTGGPWKFRSPLKHTTRAWPARCTDAEGMPLSRADIALLVMEQDARLRAAIDSPDDACQWIAADCEVEEPATVIGVVEQGAARAALFSVGGKMLAVVDRPNGPGFHAVDRCPVCGAWVISLWSWHAPGSIYWTTMPLDCSPHDRSTGDAGSDDVLGCLSGLQRPSRVPYCIGT